MNKDFNLNSWKVDNLDGEERARLNNTISRKYAKRVVRRRALKATLAVLLLFIAAGSVFYIHEKTFGVQVTRLNQMLEQEMERVPVPQFLVELNGRSEEIDMEDIYD